MTKRPPSPPSSRPPDGPAPATAHVGPSVAGQQPDPVSGVAAWRRLLRTGRPRATRANLLAAALAVALGIAIATQVQLTNERDLGQLSQSDLIRVLDDVSVRNTRLDQQVRDLEATRDRLKSGVGTSADTIEQARKRLDTLGILAGAIGAQGPGIVLTIRDPSSAVTGPIILDVIQELRDAGAEAIDVGGVRVVASSFVGNDGGTLRVDGKTINRPVVIKAIGEPKTLASAMIIPGGIVETVRQKGASATVAEQSNLQITSRHDPRPMTRATPVP